MMTIFLTLVGPMRSTLVAAAAILVRFPWPAFVICLGYAVAMDTAITTPARRHFLFIVTSNAIQRHCLKRS